MGPNDFTKARATKWAKVSILPRRHAHAATPSSNNNIIYRIYCLFNNNNSHIGDAANIHLRGDTLRLRNTLPLCGRSPSLATVCSTYPIPSCPALLHKDTALHGAPTVEDAQLCLQGRFPRAKHAIEQKLEPDKILSPPSRGVIRKNPLLRRTP